MKKAKNQWQRHEESHDEERVQVYWTSRQHPGWRVILLKDVRGDRYKLAMDGMPTSTGTLLQGFTPAEALQSAEEWLSGQNHARGRMRRP